MKYRILMVFVLGVATMFSQGPKKEGVNYKKVNKNNLQYVEFYHENGQVAQKGYFTKDLKRQGTWKSYDEKGNKTSIAHYKNDQKVGKWMHWLPSGRLMEVDYEASEIVAVHEWSNKEAVAID